MTKLTLTPSARAMLRDLYAKADEFAQLPVVKMTKEETWAFLKAAPVRTVRLTGKTDAEVWEHWNKTLGTNHPFPDDFEDDTPDDGA
jgi:hypothetical protein